jgi:hypothetical protein
MTPIYIDFTADPCARKSRYDTQSAKAFRSGDKVTDCGVILDLIKRNPEGLTIDDCSRILERSPNSISGRFVQLRTLNLIYADGLRKTRANVNAKIWKAK